MEYKEKSISTIEMVGKKCVGCRSCEQKCPKGCISIKANKEGFLYPVVNTNECIGCKICVNSCPAVKVPKSRKPISVYALKNKDKKRLLSSASGGASDVFARYIIKNNGIVYGCTCTSDMSVKHIEVKEEKYLKKIQSSKYVQSDLNNTYTKVKKNLDNGKMVLFTGTPCQIAGLNTFLGGEQYDNLYTLDLICHGVPSPLLFKKYLAYQSEKMKEPVIYFNFRSKNGKGWGSQYLFECRTKNKISKCVAPVDKYGKYFKQGNCYRESCYTCEYSSIKRISDITVGDFWGIDKSHPEFSSTLGVSSVLVNTEKGQKLFDSIKEYADYTEATVDEAMVKQANLKSATLRPASRDTFYNNIEDNDFIAKLKVGLCLKSRIKQIIPVSVISWLKRIL